MLLGIGHLLLIYLPITIAAMFIAAPWLDLAFGEFGPAIAKIAGIYVFTFGGAERRGHDGPPGVGLDPWPGGVAGPVRQGVRTDLRRGHQGGLRDRGRARAAGLGDRVMLPHQARDEAPSPPVRQRRHPPRPTNRVTMSPSFSPLSSARHCPARFLNARTSMIAFPSEMSLIVVKTIRVG